MNAPSARSRQPRRHTPLLRASALAASALLLASCGGGGGGSGGPGSPSDPLAQSCSTKNPYRNDAVRWDSVKREYVPATVVTGTMAGEKTWLDTYFRQAYLWPSEIPSVDASRPEFSDESSGTAFYASMRNYFHAHRTTNLDAYGKYKDQFSFTMPTKEWTQVITGAPTGSYGVDWGVEFAYDSNGYITNMTQAVVREVDVDTPASRAGMKRGDVVVSIDNKPITSSAEWRNLYSTMLYPTLDGGKSHAFVLSNGGVQRTVTVVPQTLSPIPVPQAKVITTTQGTKVGYLVFDDHIKTAEGALLNAVNTLKAGGATELVLDVRYNGGGYLYIASELAYMIAGAKANGKTFEKQVYSAQRVSDTNHPDSTMLFWNKSTTQQALPELGFSRVSVITTGDTCSASEAIINGLRGLDGMDVRVIGSNSCGKPYGFTAMDNCGISYLPIEFEGVNAKGEGGYVAGFAPTCAASDDLTRNRGDASEKMLAQAIYNLETGNCNEAYARASRSGVMAGAINADALRALRKPGMDSARVLLPKDGR